MRRCGENISFKETARYLQFHETASHVHTHMLTLSLSLTLVILIARRQKQRRKTWNVHEDILERATGGDGTLPGGMPPDMLPQLMPNPELMTLMSNLKMQDVMKLMMATGGQGALEVVMIEDKEVNEIVNKLNSIMDDAM